jgi:chromosome partitioning protein
MKTLLIAAEKGGTGRSALLCQLAHYLRRVRGARVLVLDLAEPACSTVSLTRTDRAVVLAGERALAIPHTQSGWMLAPRIQVLPGGVAHGLSSDLGESSARYYANMRHLLRVVAPFVDVCLIDCPPLPDPRAVCAEANADAMLSPIVLSRKTLDSTDDLINGPYGVRNVRARLNPALRFFGLLPNMVEDTPLQRAQARALQAQMGAWLIPDPRDPDGFLQMPRLDAIAQAQVAGVSVHDIAMRDAAACPAWRAMRHCFDEITLRLDCVSAQAPGTGTEGEPAINPVALETVHV